MRVPAVSGGKERMAALVVQEHQRATSEHLAVPRHQPPRDELA